jgi:hypothetical protein
MSEYPVFPDPETMLIYALVPQNPDIRFVTVMPFGDPTMITARIRRTGGTVVHVGLDRPVIDIDVFGPKSQIGNVSAAAREIQSQMMSLMSAVVSNGVFQRVTTIMSPRQLPEVNPGLVRYSATYELQVHP